VGRQVQYRPETREQNLNPALREFAVQRPNRVQRPQMSFAKPERGEAGFSFTAALSPLFAEFLSNSANQFNAIRCEGPGCREAVACGENVQSPRAAGDLTNFVPKVFSRTTRRRSTIRTGELRIGRLWDNRKRRKKSATISNLPVSFHL